MHMAGMESDTASMRCDCMHACMRGSLLLPNPSALKVAHSLAWHMVAYGGIWGLVAETARLNMLDTPGPHARALYKAFTDLGGWMDGSSPQRWAWRAHAAACKLHFLSSASPAAASTCGPPLPLTLCHASLALLPQPRASSTTLIPATCWARGWRATLCSPAAQARGTLTCARSSARCVRNAPLMT